MCEMTPISVRLNLKNFILISCAVLELLRKVSQGGRNPPPPGEIGLSQLYKAETVSVRPLRSLQGSSSLGTASKSFLTLILSFSSFGLLPKFPLRNHSKRFGNFVPNLMKPD